MKFRLITTKAIYEDPDDDDDIESENEMSFLSKLGFEFEKRIVFEKERTFIEDKVNDKHVEIEINNLEDLLNFINELQQNEISKDIVISKSNPIFEQEYTIEIYNGYRE
jgi:hypothetical protein